MTPFQLDRSKLYGFKILSAEHNSATVVGAKIGNGKSARPAAPIAAKIGRGKGSPVCLGAKIGNGKTGNSKNR